MLQFWPGLLSLTA
jgi:hypothetical protein